YRSESTRRDRVRCASASSSALVNPDTIASATNDPAQQITRSESTPDLGRRQVVALELKACRPGHDEQVREMAERGNDVLRDAVAKEILGGIVGEVLERQYRHRWATGKMRRDGEARDLDRLWGGAEPEQLAAHS